MPNAQLNMIPGRRYRIVYRRPEQRRDRFMVADYLGVSRAFELEGGSIELSGRPVFGTTSLLNKWIKSIIPVRKNTAIVVEKLVQ